MLFWRITADFLWEYKFISVFVNIAALIIVLRLVITSRFTRRQIAIVFVVLLLIFLNCFTLIKSYNMESAVLFIKITMTLLIFFYGMLGRNFEEGFKQIASLSVVLLLVEFLLVTLNLGFQYWGMVRTFSGTYYFKTDLALALVIGLTFILFSTKLSNAAKIGLWVLTVYLILMTNARVHFGTVFAVTSIYLLRNQVLKRFFTIAVLASITGAFVFYFVVDILNSLSGEGFLVLDLSIDKFFSSENLQGRNTIWIALINGFLEASLFDRITGLGLTADELIYFNRNNDPQIVLLDDSYNSHNTFIFVLIAWGYLGCLAFGSFILGSVQQFLRILRRKELNDTQNTILLLFLCHMLIFLITGFSNSAILYQQQAWFFTCFCGILFNRRYFARTNMGS